MPHPEGEGKITFAEGVKPGGGEALVIETEGGRYQVQWDDGAPATPYGQLVFFAQFLKAGGLFGRLCAGAPFEFKSNNAPPIIDVLGTLVLSILAGHRDAAIERLEPQTSVVVARRTKTPREPASNSSAKGLPLLELSGVHLGECHL